MFSMTWIIDAHQDIAYESLLHRRDYKRPVAESRAAEAGNHDRQITLGYPEYRQAQIGIIFATVFLEKIRSGAREPQIGIEYRTPDEFHRSVQTQIDFYQRWDDDPDRKFRLLRGRNAWNEQVSILNDPEQRETAPIGIILLIEGAEGLRSFADLDEYIDAGLRLIGPVWGGGRWCACAWEDPRDGFTSEGYELLNAMNERGLILDVSHMNKKSAEQALTRYDRSVVATHCNCAALLKRTEDQRHLHDETIRLIIERNGVIGVIPGNEFLSSEWKPGGDRRLITLDTLANHIDHICQLAGNADNAALGTDFDGGFGYPDIPYEMNHIGDLGKIRDRLENRGYSASDIAKICHGNWRRIIESGAF